MKISFLFLAISSVSAYPATENYEEKILSRQKRFISFSVGFSTDPGKLKRLLIA